MAARNIPLAERFWRKVSRPGMLECWEWQGSFLRRGYGQFSVSHASTCHAHRMAYLLTFPEWDGKGFVCHRCDNPPCCNPAHLFVGTHQENMRDMIAKGRKIIMRGTAHGRGRLTEADILEIRQSTKTGIELAAEFGVSQSHISGIRHRRFWSHI